MKLSRSQSAFSLVELSIVLVILGLLVGGVLSGQSLIRAGELRAVSTEITRYHTAVYTFRDKYFAMPGDMANATSFWGNADTGANGGECAAPLTNAGTGTQTCNGNGNGMFDWGPEERRVWQHLANAGLIEGRYSGIGPEMVAGSNVPASKLANNSYRYLPEVPLYGKTAISNALRIGRISSGYFGNDEGILKAEEARNIDVKSDDGLADSGKLFSTCGADFSNFATTPYTCLGCTTVHWGATTGGSYILSDTNKSCAMSSLLN